MAIVYSENVIEIAVNAVVGSTPHVNVWHMYTEEGPEAGDAGAARDFANNWQDHILQGVAGSYTLVGFDWRSLDPDDSNVGTLLPDPAKFVTGQATGTPLPPNVALLVHKRTQNRPRGKKDGRMFLGGIQESDVDGFGGVLPSFVTGMNALLQSFLDGVSDDGVSTGDVRYPVVLETTPASRAPGSLPVTLNKRRVTALQVDPLISTQRDRLGR